MPNFKTFLILVNRKAFIVAGLAVLSTALCLRYGVTADFPLTLIAIAIVFPIVFSIGGAYKRREAALDDYASLKAHGRAIYFAARDWPETTDAATLTEARKRLGNLLGACRTLFTQPPETMEQNEKVVYQAFSDLSRFIRGFRAKGLATGEVSRCNQYLSKMMVAFESVKHIYQYRTPISLRTYSDVFIVLLSIAYGPFFASIVSEKFAFLTYVLPVLMSLILVSLDNIQAHLENPFDQVGDDDLNINADKFVKCLEDLTVSSEPARRTQTEEPTHSGSPTF